MGRLSDCHGRHLHSAYLLGMSYWIVNEGNREGVGKEIILPLYQKALKDWIRYLLQREKWMWVKKSRGTR